MNLLNDVPNCITRIAKKLRKWKIILLFWKIFHSSKCQTNKKCQGEKNQSLLLTALNPGRINIKSTIKRKHEINKQFKKNCYSGIHDGYTSTGSEANEHHNIKTQTEKKTQKRGSYTYNYPGLAINWKVWFRLDGWCLKGHFYYKNPFLQ